MMSASESSSRPSVEEDCRQRATRPSSASKTKAAGIRAMPMSRSRTTPSCRKRIAAKTAPVPQNALASVNQSARWKPRIIEKWRGCFGGTLGGVFMDGSCQARTGAASGRRYGPRAGAGVRAFAPCTSRQIAPERFCDAPHAGLPAPVLAFWLLWDRPEMEAKPMDSMSAWDRAHMRELLRKRYGTLGRPFDTAHRTRSAQALTADGELITTKRQTGGGMRPDTLALPLAPLAARVLGHLGYGATPA